MKKIETKFGEAFYESLVGGVTSISPDILQLMEEALAEEKSPPAKAMLEAMLQNVELAQKLRKGVCQSPGIPCIYLRCGPKMAGIDVKKIAEESIIRATREKEGWGTAVSGLLKNMTWYTSWRLLGVASSTLRQ